MTATIALTTAEVGIIERGKAVLARAEAEDFPFPWLAKRSSNVEVCKTALHESLEEHAAITAGSRHPESVFPHLRNPQDDDTGITREWLAEDINWNTGALVIAIREACGEDAAAFVRGTEGGE
jgi:hypothetical protein